jgi:uncharacterized damage-inducible protein DinB
MNSSKSELKGLIIELKSIYNGKPWYGESFTKVTGKIPVSNAYWKPSPSSHSIAQIVLHIIYWRQLLLKRLEGDLNFKSSIKSEENWPSEKYIKNLGWPSILKLMDSSHIKLIRLLQKQNDSLLDENFNDKITYRNLIKGILQHDLYHLGQIAYLNSIQTK